MTQNVNPQRRSAIDGRTATQLDYWASQRRRKRIEEIFGWWKTVAGGRKLRCIGSRRATQLWAELTSAAYNLVRMANLVPQPGVERQEHAPAGDRFPPWMTRIVSYASRGPKLPLRTASNAIASAPRWRSAFLQHPCWRPGFCGLTATLAFA